MSQTIGLQHSISQPPTGQKTDGEAIIAKRMYAIAFGCAVVAVACALIGIGVSMI